MQLCLKSKVVNEILNTLNDMIQPTKDSINAIMFEVEGSEWNYKYIEWYNIAK